MQAREAAVMRKAHQEAQRLIDDTLAKSRALFEEQQKKLAEKQSAQRVWQESQKKLKTWREQLEEETPEPVFAGNAPKSVRIGDSVFLPRLNQYGNIVGLPDNGGEATVQFGVVKMKVKLSELRLVDADKMERRQRKGARNAGANMALRKSAQVSPTLDLHGMDTMEAHPILDKYIDDAFIAGLKTVEINHGRGMGILRNFVHEYLRGNRLVKSFRDGTYHEGGIGVTIVELNV